VSEFKHLLWLLTGVTTCAIVQAVIAKWIAKQWSGLFRFTAVCLPSRRVMLWWPACFLVCQRLS